MHVGHRLSARSGWEGLPLACTERSTGPMSSAKRVKYDRQRSELVVIEGSDEIRLEVLDEGFYSRREDVADVNASELRRALAVSRRSEEAKGIDWEVGLGVERTEYEVIDHEYAPASPVSIILTTEGHLAIDVGVMLREYPEDDPAFVPRLRRLLDPMLDRRAATFVSVEADDSYVAPPYLVTIRVKPTIRGRSVGYLFEIGEAVGELVSTSDADQLELTRTTARDLVRGGRADLLIGQPEGPWLDVKARAYDLNGDAGKISLAQDVAKFANAEHGGLLIIGLEAKKVPGGEVVRSIRPVTVDGKELRRHEQAISNRLYPPPEFLSVEVVDIERGQIMLIDVPSQPEELKPFLVHGAIVDGKIEGAFISIIRRRGEASIPIQAQAIHSTLAAGRALLRRGQLPDDER